MPFSTSLGRQGKVQSRCSNDKGVATIEVLSQQEVPGLLTGGEVNLQSENLEMQQRRCGNNYLLAVAGRHHRHGQGAEEED